MISAGDFKNGVTLEIDWLQLPPKELKAVH